MKDIFDQKFQQGFFALKEGNFNLAEQLYRSILEIHPKHSETSHNLGIALQKLGRFSEAEEFYKKAIELKPDFALAHYNLGSMLNDLLRLDEAEASYRKVIELKPDYVMAHNNLGNILKALNRFDEAEASYRKVIELKPDFAEVYSNIAGLLTDIGKLDEAEASYRKAIKLKPSLKVLYNSLDIVLRLKELSSKILQFKNIDSKTKAKIDNSLIKDYFISNREVEPELINTLYQIELIDLEQTNTDDARFGNGKCSNFKLFKNNFSIIKKVEEDLIGIISKSVNSEIYIIDSFFNILRTQSGTTPHKHISYFDKTRELVNKKFSLTYYLSVGDQNCSEPGNLKVYDPDEEIIVSEGKIVIIPANRVHSAVYNGKTDRVMIGINFYCLS